MLQVLVLEREDGLWRTFQECRGSMESLWVIVSAVLLWEDWPLLLYVKFKLLCCDFEPVTSYLSELFMEVAVKCESLFWWL